MFSRQRRFNDDDDDQNNDVITSDDHLISNIRLHARISPDDGLAVGERLIEWGSSLRKKLDAQAVRESQEKLKKAVNDLAPTKLLSQDQANSSANRLYRDVERMQLTREHRINKEHSSKSRREEEALSSCTFKPKLLTEKFKHVSSRYLNNNNTTESHPPTSPSFKPKINSTYRILPKERNVYKRLYADREHHSNSNSQQQLKSATVSPEDLSEFLSRQENYETHKQLHLKELAGMYDHSYTPEISAKSRRLSEAVHSKPLLRYIEEKQEKRTKRIISQYKDYGYNSDALKNFENLSANSKKINKERVSSALSRAKRKPSKVRVESKETTPTATPRTPVPEKKEQKTTSESDATAYYEKQSEKLKNRKDRMLRLQLEEMILQVAESKAASNVTLTTKMLPRRKPMDTIKQQHSKSIPPSSTTTRRKDWNSSTEPEKQKRPAFLSSSAPIPETVTNSPYKVSSQHAIAWYARQQEFVEQKKQHVEEERLVIMADQCPFVPNLCPKSIQIASMEKSLGDEAVSMTETTTSFLDRVKKSISESSRVINSKR